MTEILEYYRSQQGNIYHQATIFLYRSPVIDFKTGMNIEHIGFIYLLLYFFITVVIFFALKKLGHKPMSFRMTGAISAYKNDVFYGVLWKWDYSEKFNVFYITGLKAYCRIDNQKMGINGNGFLCPTCKREFKNITEKTGLPVYQQLEYTKYLILKKIRNNYN